MAELKKKEKGGGGSGGKGKWVSEVVCGDG